MINRRHLLAGGSLAMIALSTRVLAHDIKTHEVFMHNMHPDDPKIRMVFTPRILKVTPGATVKFVPNDPGHNCLSTPGMIPDGAESWSGAFGKTISVVFDVPGIYGYHCMPHRSMGMVGLVIVEGPGMLDNLDAAKTVKQRGGSKSAWNEIWNEVSDRKLLE